MKPAEPLKIKKAASTSRDPAQAVRELKQGLAQPDTALVIVFCSPEYDLAALGAALKRDFQHTQLIGCTTAGEITPLGYLTGALTGVSIASKDFRAVVRAIPHLKDFQFSEGDGAARTLLQELRALGTPPQSDNTFGFLLIDGLCNQEELVVSTLSRALGEIQLFGGSAGDGTKFGSTFVYHNGEFVSDTAIFTLMQTHQPFVVFKTQHFVSTSEKMVVTAADPKRRTVMELNGEPAAREYACRVGVSFAELTPRVFAAHPVVVKVGGQHYVRSIQRVNPDESLTFFCAIDDGIVLTIASGVDLIDNLKQALADVRKKVGEPQIVLGCDCILRHLELDEKGIKTDVGRIFADNNVIGFSTYGEQFNAMHVNQTFTAVAIGTGLG